MYIKDIEIRNFGKFQNVKMDFSPGINVVYGPNEAGKSTLQVFLKSMLFGLEKTRVRNSLDEYQRSAPWNAPAYFAGSMHFQTGGQTFYLERNFYHKEQGATLRNVQDGEELSVEQGDLTMLLGGVSRQTYENTFSIGQNQAETDSSLGNTISDRMNNLAATGDDSFQLSAAMDYLKDCSQQLKKSAREAKSQKEYALRLLQEKEQILLSDIERLQGRLQEQQQELNGLQQEEGRAAAAKTAGDRGAADQNTPVSDKADQGSPDLLRTDRGQTNPTYSQQEADLSQVSTPHRTKWNKLMTGGVVLLLISLLLTKNGTIPKTPGIVLSVVFLIMIIAGIVQEMGRQRRGEQEQVSRLDGQTLTEQSTDRSRQVDPSAQEPLADLSGQDPERDWEAKSHEEFRRRQSQIRAAIAILEEERLEKETELANNRAEQNDLQYTDDQALQLRREIEAVALAEKTLQGLAGSHAGERMAQLKETMSQILSEITDGTYHSLQLDDRQQLQVTADEHLRVPQAMSFATREQIYFAWRMAAGRLAASEEALPYLLDETFAHYDDRRLQQTLKWLGRQNHQIFLFSCQDRETDCLTELGIPFRRIEL